MISGSDSKTLIENSKIDPRYAAVWAEIHAQQQIEARELEQEEMQELQQKYGKAFTLEVTKWKKIDEDNEGIQYLMIYRKGNDLHCDIVEYVHYEILDGKKPDILLIRSDVEPLDVKLAEQAAGISPIAKQLKSGPTAAAVRAPGRTVIAQLDNSRL